MTLSNEGSFVAAENDEIRVIIQPGTSDFLLITFGDLVTPASGLRFFADGPSRKEKISCVGFMAKRGNWYPAASMNDLIDTMSPFLSNYKTIVSYGGSMGGYAAIKYSKRLKVTHVIALCPQWSIDRGECQGVDPGWQNYFDEKHLTGMGIKNSDCGGAIFVFYDCYNKTDAFHAREIELVSHAYLVPMPRVDHHVTPTLSGTKNLMKLIDYCRDEDISSIRRLVRENRRRSRHRINQILSFAELNFPRRLPPLVTQLFSKGEIPNLDNRYAFLAMRRLSQLGDSKRVCAIFERYKPNFDGLLQVHSSALYLAQSGQVDIQITTFHDSIMCYDFGRHDLVHLDSGRLHESPTTVPVQILLKRDFVCFFVNVAGQRIYIGYQNGIICISYVMVDDYWLESKSSKAALFSLESNGKYLCAQREGGSLVCNRESAGSWEMFSIRLGPVRI